LFSQNNIQEDMMETPIREKYNTEKVIYMALELSQSTWKLGFNIEHRQETRVRTIAAAQLEALEEEIRLAKQKYQVGAETRVLSCYEAGLDGFWIHRYLTSIGVENVVVDPASVEVNRRAKQRKTDRLDAQKLVRHLMRYHAGDTDVSKVVRIPSEEAEESRHLHRQMWNLKNDWKRYRNRIYGLLKLHGVTLSINQDFIEEMTAVRIWNGGAIPPEAQKRIRRNYKVLQVLTGEIKELERERKALIKTGESRAIKMVRQLGQLRGVGDHGAWLLVMEFFWWREFKNRREVGGLAGLAPTPYASGSLYHEQGISKAGNRWVRTMMVQLAWAWLRYQPDSQLSQRWQDEYKNASKAERKKGIVALARKLIVAFWKYLDRGEVPAGARLKTVP
jgi:transposase